jgi:hypothetical protein
MITRKEQKAIVSHIQGSNSDRQIIPKRRSLQICAEKISGPAVVHNCSQFLEAIQRKVQRSVHPVLT